MKLIRVEGGEWVDPNAVVAIRKTPSAASAQLLLPGGIIVYVLDTDVDTAAADVNRHRS